MSASGTRQTAGTVQGAAGSLHYARGGDGSPLLLLHAAGLSHRMWESVLDRFSAHFDVITLDSRGHGASETDGDDYAVTDMADDIETLLDALGLESVAICGVSIGGCAGLTFAGTRPSRVSRLVLCETTAWYGEDAPARFAARAQHIATTPRDVEFADHVSHWLSPAFMERRPEVGAGLGELFTSTPPNRHAEAVTALGTLDARPILSAVTAPTLVISGTDEFSTPEARGRMICDGIPEARLVALAGRHYMILENQEALGMAIDHLRTDG